MESVCYAGKDKKSYGINVCASMFSRKKYKDMTYEFLMEKRPVLVDLVSDTVLEEIGGFFRGFGGWDFKATVERVAFSEEVCSFDKQNELLMNSVAIELLYQVLLIEAMSEYRVRTGLEISARELLGKFCELIAKKNADYGAGNIVQMGLLGISRLIINKMNRYKNLSASDKPCNFESLVDTIADTACYAILGFILCKKFLYLN